MTRKLLILICFSTLLFSCSKKETWYFETKKYELKTTLPCDNDDCTYVDLIIPTIISDQKELNEINEVVFKNVKKHIAFENENEEINNYDELAKSFIASYDEIKKAFPNEPLPWEASVNGTSEIFENKSVNIVLNYYTFTGGAHGSEGTLSLFFNLEDGKPISQKDLFLDYYTFTGGAHGNEGTISLFFNLEDGKQISQKDLFLDYEGFKKIAERDFRTSNNLNETDNINKNGNIFKDNQFSLPENIIVTQNEIILHYNKYEIAPYSSGATLLKFPMKTFKKYLNPLYF